MLCFFFITKKEYSVHILLAESYKTSSIHKNENRGVIFGTHSRDRPVSGEFVGEFCEVG